MKILYLSIIVVILSCCKPQGSNGTWSIINIPAPSLANNILSDANQKQIGVYLPPSYLKSTRKYPVVYFLQGYGGKIDSDFIGAILDSLINENQIPEIIGVEISGVYSFKGSFYVNSPVSGNWDDFVTKDVISYIDENCRTLAKAESRALAGISMGGFGVLNLIMHHPDTYKIAYSMSPGLFNEKGLSECLMFHNGGTIKPILSLIEKLKPLTKEEAHTEFLKYAKSINQWEVEFTLAYGMAFAPNTLKAPYLDFPLSVIGNDTIKNMKIWEKWENGFGICANEFEKNRKNLEKLKLLVLDCGYNDTFKWIPKGTSFFEETLSKNNIAHQMIWHQGTHDNRFIYQLKHVSFPVIAGSLEFN